MIWEWLKTNHKKKKLGQCEKHIDYEKKRALRWIMLCSEIFVKLNAFVLYLPYLALREREREREIMGSNSNFEKCG